MMGGPVRVEVVSGLSEPAPPPDAGVLRVCWQGPGRNAVRELAPPLDEAAGAIARDLVDLAAAAYLADINAPRGRNEAWVRDIGLTVPVREPERWEAAKFDLTRLLHVLTRDNFAINFAARSDDPNSPAPPHLPSDTDCISLLSGGLDSLAGAVVLLRSGRRPLFLIHRSGNPTAEAAQRHVLEVIARLSGKTPRVVSARVMPLPPLSDTPAREPSRRARSLVFMAVAAACAQATGISDLYLWENGFFSAGLPLSPARAGSLSTRSTHPIALHIFGELAATIGLPGELQNPFLYRTKAELIREVLRPVLPPRDIQRTVSCWAAGRTHRPCGGCVPCLLRRIAMLAAGLGDEACEMDVLAEPERYRGTDAYANLVDILTQAAAVMSLTDVELLLRHPQLLDMQAAGANVLDMLAVVRRHAIEVIAVVEEHFPAAGRMVEAEPL